MYVQLGQENGGIVVNLGKNGLAFQAAMKLNVEKNSKLSLRLRGSGLTVDLAGEIVWLGATQKDAGICFQSVSDGVQREIADWVERQTQCREGLEPADAPRAKSMSAMAGIGAQGDSHAPRSLSAALAMSRAVPADPQPGADADAIQSVSNVSLESAAALAESALPEIVSPIAESEAPATEWGEDLEDSDAVSVPSPEPTQVEQPVQNQPPLELTAIENLRELLARQSTPIVDPETTPPQMPEEPLQASAEPIDSRESSKAGETELRGLPEHPALDDSSSVRLQEDTSEPGNCPPAMTAENLSDSNIPGSLAVGINSAREFSPMETQGNRDSPANDIPQNDDAEEISADIIGGRDMAQAPVLTQSPRAPDPFTVHQVSLPEPTAAEKWIPPVLLATWRRGNRQQKMLIGGTGGVCVLIFGAILALAVAGINRQGRHAEDMSRQQTTARVIPSAPLVAAVIPVASAAKVETQQSAVPQTLVPPPEPLATPEEDSDQPPPSLLANFKQAFLGTGKKEVTVVRPAMNRNQIGVQVWTFKSTGYYYCADSPYYKTLQPGNIMTQVDALQSGYQPRLEQYCN